MKVCPICELNLIQDGEDVCFSCSKEKLLRKYKTEEFLNTLVEPSQIRQRVSASAIFRAVRYLSSDYGEYSIYEKSNKWSYRSLLNYLRKNFNYAIIKFSSKAGFSYVFDCDDIWNNFFLKNEKLNSVLQHRRISAMDELLYNSSNWHNAHHKTRKV